MLLIGAAVTVIIFMQRFFSAFLIKWGFSLTSTEIEVDENLPNFFEAVKLNDADWVVFEN